MDLDAAVEISSTLARSPRPFGSASAFHSAPSQAVRCSGQVPTSPSIPPSPLCACEQQSLKIVATAGTCWKQCRCCCLSSPPIDLQGGGRCSGFFYALGVI
mmetsp:Transcript_47805/g.77795  ORF Transcript_47805/g.77795 Transcript_47805/m.77795 type:complete len:101 (+) Transcript_47805:3172-3474(+)